jgi:hypothetical protein
MNKYLKCIKTERGNERERKEKMIEKKRRRRRRRNQGMIYYAIWQTK